MIKASACFKIVNKCKFQNLQDLNSRTFQGFSSTFKHLICFQALSRALKFLFQIQAFSRFSQARYKPWSYCSIDNAQNSPLWTTPKGNYTYISDGDIPGSAGAEVFPVGSVNSGIFFFPLYAIFDKLLQSSKTHMITVTRRNTILFFCIQNAQINARYSNHIIVYTTGTVYNLVRNRWCRWKTSRTANLYLYLATAHKFSHKQNIRQLGKYHS